MANVDAVGGIEGDFVVTRVCAIVSGNTVASMACIALCVFAHTVPWLGMIPAAIGVGVIHVLIGVSHLGQLADPKEGVSTAFKVSRVVMLLAHLIAGIGAGALVLGFLPSHLWVWLILGGVAGANIIFTIRDTYAQVCES